MYQNFKTFWYYIMMIMSSIFTLIAFDDIVGTSSFHINIKNQRQKNKYKKW